MAALPYLKETSREGYLYTYRLEKEAEEIFTLTAAVRKGTWIQERTARDISRNPERAEEIFRLLSDNAVSPLHLDEILSELL